MAEPRFKLRASQLQSEFHALFLMEKITKLQLRKLLPTQDRHKSVASESSLQFFLPSVPLERAGAAATFL